MADLIADFGVWEAGWTGEKGATTRDGANWPAEIADDGADPCLSEHSARIAAVHPRSFPKTKSTQQRCDL